LLKAVTGASPAVVQDFYRRSNAGERDIAAFFHAEVEWHRPAETPGTMCFRVRTGQARPLDVK